MLFKIQFFLYYKDLTKTSLKFIKTIIFFINIDENIRRS